VKVKNNICEEVRVSNDVRDGVIRVRKNDVRDREERTAAFVTKKAQGS
jgi:hypothetical protein